MLLAIAITPSGTPTAMPTFVPMVESETVELALLVAAAAVASGELVASAVTVVPSEVFASAVTVEIVAAPFDVVATAIVVEVVPLYVLELIPSHINKGKQIV
jgi:hypothetical protein